MARGSGMQIEKIYVYPIKSFRGVEVDSAILTKHGFPYDRTFMLLHHATNKKTGEKEWQNMSVANYNEMVRFLPTFNHPKDGDATITVTFHPVDQSEKRSIEIPLQPDTSSLEEVDVVMHLSPTKAYKMPAEYNDWLSSCFGYEVILAYLGENLREVRMSNDKWKTSSSEAQQQQQTESWLSSLASKAAHFLTSTDPTEISAIRFSDVAPYLFVSSKSMEDIHPRLGEGEEMDITKFRPNIIVSGAQEAWEEDFWGELTIGSGSGSSDGEGTKVHLEHNCGRCASINVDYETGAQGTGESGTILKKLMKDRRVDVGAKWAPVFGRYAFLPPESEGKVIKVGEEVKVSRVNGERTAFDWQGLSTLKGGGRD